jgi:starch synthase
MKILIATSEIATLAPVGGIAEYVLGLSAALIRAGHDVRVALPAYAHLLERSDVTRTVERLVVPMGTAATFASPVYETAIECLGPRLVRVPVILLCEHAHFASVRATGQVYDWPNHEPWVAFSRAVVAYIEQMPWKPDVVHCQDAHAALIPVFLRAARQKSRSGASGVRWPKTIVTIHNLLNQGLSDPTILDYAGLGREWFTGDAFEYYGRANGFKAGLLCADGVTTVSRTYADEIKESKEFGFGLEGVLRGLPSVTGIVNGIDDDRWHAPDLDYTRPSADAVRRLKRATRDKLFAAWNWRVDDEAVIAFRGRWDDQKNVRLVAECMPEILRRARMVLCTWGVPGGDEDLRRAWKALEASADVKPDRLLINPKGIGGVDETALHYTIADFFLMPSRYEPCGLTQMEAQRFGTIPIVRRTGGLADTVFEAPQPGVASPNGFVFDGSTAEVLLSALDRALAKKSAGTLDDVIENTLRQANAWQHRVPEYEATFA